MLALACPLVDVLADTSRNTGISCGTPREKSALPLQPLKEPLVLKTPPTAGPTRPSAKALPRNQSANASKHPPKNPCSGPLVTVKIASSRKTFDSDTGGAPGAPRKT